VKTQPKFHEGQIVRVVHKALGDLKVPIKGHLPGGLYIIEYQGHLLTVQEKYISEE
jgi:hypothetical protein